MKADDKELMQEVIFRVPYGICMDWQEKEGQCRQRKCIVMTWCEKGLNKSRLQDAPWDPSLGAATKLRGMGGTGGWSLEEIQVCSKSAGI